MSYLGAESGRTRGHSSLAELELLRGRSRGDRATEETRERRRGKRKRPKGSRGREDAAAAAAASTAESPRSPSAAPCASQPGSAAAPPRLFPPRARPCPAPPRSALSCHRRSVGEGERRAPPPAAASSPPRGDSQPWSSREPRPAKAKGGEGSGDLAPSFPGVACSVPRGSQNEQQRQPASLRTTLRSPGQSFQSVVGRVACLRSLSFPSLYHS